MVEDASVGVIANVASVPCKVEVAVGVTAPGPVDEAVRVKKVGVVEVPVEVPTAVTVTEVEVALLSPYLSNTVRLTRYVPATAKV